MRGDGDAFGVRIPSCRVISAAGSGFVPSLNENTASLQSAWS